MSSIHKTDVVAEYLREVDLRLSGLPLLQRRELVADLEAHIESARERGAYTESEMIEVLQRLGSPEVVAAAAYWEAGPQPPRRDYEPVDPPEKPARTGIPGWAIAAIVGVTLLFLFCGAAGVMFTTKSSDVGGPVAVPAEPVAPAAPHAPEPPEPPVR